MRTYNQVARGILNGMFNQEGMEAFFTNLGTSRDELLQMIEERPHSDMNEPSILNNIEKIKNNELK